MSSDLFSDFSVGGCPHSNPISPGGEAPSFVLWRLTDQRKIDFLFAFRSGSRYRNFAEETTKLIWSLPDISEQLDAETRLKISELASKCRVGVSVGKLLERYCGLRRNRLETEHSVFQREVLAALRSGSRARNFSRRILKVVSELPPKTEALTEEDVSAVRSLAAKCRCVNLVLEILGIIKEKSPKPPAKKRVKLSEEKRREKRRAERRAWKKKQKTSNKPYRILHALRKRLSRAIGRNRKSDRTLVLLGCSLAEFCKHLESKWQPGMSWDNYGSSGWHIDHIRPCASFDMSNPEEQGEG